jgi:hypothetical protein
METSPNILLFLFVLFLSGTIRCRCISEVQQRHPGEQCTAISSDFSVPIPDWNIHGSSYDCKFSTGERAFEGAYMLFEPFLSP